MAENEKRQRGQILKLAIDDLKKENSDLQGLIYSEKHSNMKLNSIFVDLTTALAKI